MISFLSYVYQGSGLLFYGYLSLVLFTHLQIKRWFWFSVGFFLFYGLGGVVFFGEWPFPLNSLPHRHLMHQFVSLIPAMAFVVGSPLLFGCCLVWGMSFVQTIGVLIVYSSLIFLVMMGGALFSWWPIGIAHLISPIIRGWLEGGSLAVLVLGIPGIIGFGLAQSMEFRKIAGMMMLFLVALAPFFSVIYLMTEFYYFHQFVDLNPRLFPGVSR